MNILHIISVPASGGAEVYVKDMAIHLSEQGHSLHIAFVSKAKNVSRDPSFEVKFLESLHSSGVKTYFIGHECRRLPLLGALRIRKYVSENNIDICHTHLTYGILYSSLIKIPVVYTHHIFGPRWNRAIYILLNKLVDEYIGISEKCASSLKKYTGRKVSTIFNAVSINKFNNYTRQRKIKLGQKITIAMVGRLIPEKDYLCMIQALSQMPEEHLNKIKVKVAGEGNYNYKKNLIKLIEEYQLSQTIELCGNLNNIPKFLYEADIFLMTSISEGLPIALTEACISGLPSIVTDVGGCSEVINKSKSGIVVAPNNPSSIAEAITKLIINPDLIERYSFNALESSHMFSIETAANKHLEIYSKLIV